MTFLLVVRDFNDETREEGAEIVRAEPAAVGAALAPLRPGQEALVGDLQALLDDAPSRVFDFEDPQILKSRRLLFLAQELRVQFSAYDSEAKEELRYAHYGRPEDPIRFADNVE